MILDYVIYFRSVKLHVQFELSFKIKTFGCLKRSHKLSDCSTLLALLEMVGKWMGGGGRLSLKFQVLKGWFSNLHYQSLVNRTLNRFIRTVT